MDQFTRRTANNFSTCKKFACLPRKLDTQKLLLIIKFLLSVNLARYARMITAA